MLKYQHFSIPKDSSMLKRNKKGCRQNVCWSCKAPEFGSHARCLITANKYSSAVLMLFSGLRGYLNHLYHTRTNTIQLRNKIYLFFLKRGREIKVPLKPWGHHLLWCIGPYGEWISNSSACFLLSVISSFISLNLHMVEFILSSWVTGQSLSDFPTVERR